MTSRYRNSFLAILSASLTVLVGCGDQVTNPGSDGPFSESDEPGINESVCQLPDSLFADGGVPPDGIPALTKPRMVSPDDPSLGYMTGDSRVLGVVVAEQARAYPHNILWWHEIVNDQIDEHAIAVTFCPLTGSGLVFDRGGLGDRPAKGDGPDQGDRPDMGVSGLLFANNLVMYDRDTGSLFGPQMSVTARCSGFTAAEPALLPVMETSWSRWKELHPETVVIGGDTGHDRPYDVYPYGDYDVKTNATLLHPQQVDPTRPPKERVLGIRSRDGGGVGFPFDELGALGERGVVEDVVDGRPVVVFWEARDGGTAVAYDRRVAGSILEFESVANGFRDTGTGSVWDITGRAIEGPLTGNRLDGVEEAYVSFWFAWSFFQDDARLWTR